MDYKTADQLLGDRPIKTLPGIATTLHRHECGAVELYYHETPILTFTPGAVRLNHGGWKTATTKKRMNTYIPGDWRICQIAYQWYIWDTNAPDDDPIPFPAQGITLHKRDNGDWTPNI